MCYSFTLDLKSDKSAHKTHQQGLLSTQLIQQASKNWMSGCKVLQQCGVNTRILTYLWDFGNISMHKIYSELKYTRNTVQHSNSIISIRVYLPIQYLYRISLEEVMRKAKYTDFLSLSVSVFILIKMQVAQSQIWEGGFVCSPKPSWLFFFFTYTKLVIYQCLSHIS